MGIDIHAVIQIKSNDKESPEKPRRLPTKITVYILTN